MTLNMTKHDLDLNSISHHIEVVLLEHKYSRNNVCIGDPTYNDPKVTYFRNRMVVILDFFVKMM